MLPAFFWGSIRHLQSMPGAILVAEQPPGGTIVAGATWAPPGRWKAPWSRALQTAPRLVRAGLERSRRDGVPAYLELGEALIPYDERLGFSVVRAIPIRGPAVDHVGMRAG